MISLRRAALHGPWDSFAGRSWRASVLAVALTGVAIAILAAATSRALSDWRVAPSEAEETTERITFVTPPAVAAPTPPATTAPGVPSSRVAAPPAAVAPPSVVAPSPPASVAPDSVAGGSRRAVRVDPSAAPIALPPLPGLQPAATCAAPCAGGARAGFAERSNLSREAMDSVLKMMAAAAAAHVDMSANRTHAIAAPPRSTGEAQIGGGVSVPVGLPGGGPSAKQRARDRKLYAQNLESLERIKARADSVLAARRDSLRRAMAARLDSTRRGAKPDSTGR